MDDNKSEIQAQEGAGRQYGGYGNYGGYGGFVECCDGVVDPLLLLSIILGEKILVSSLIIFEPNGLHRIGLGTVYVFRQGVGLRCFPLGRLPRLSSC